MLPSKASIAPRILLLFTDIHSPDFSNLFCNKSNIQIFGKSKAGKPEVLDVLAKIIRTYDVVAIQEIRDKDQTALPKLVNLTNTNDSDYVYIVSERLGRTTNKEQYAYIYNNQTVKLNGTPHIYPEPNGTDPFHREPYIAAFVAVNGSFDVTLIVIHTDPDEATEEINALDVVVKYTQNKYPDEQDFIVMGDLNADCSYFDEDSNCSICSDDYYWCIKNSIDTTTSATNCTYDRIIITSPAVPDYTGNSGVFRYDILYNLTEEEMKAVSDHYPIYAEFYCDGDIDAPEKGRYLSVNSSPLGATIYLDGLYTGKTPRTITEVSPGDHTIKLTLESYYDWSTSVNAKTGETSYVNVTLEKISDDTEEIPTQATAPTPTPTATLFEKIEGLTAIRVGGGFWDNWDADMENDGPVIYIAYLDARGDRITDDSTTKMPISAEVKLYASDSVTGPKDKLVFSAHYTEDEIIFGSVLIRNS